MRNDIMYDIMLFCGNNTERQIIIYCKKIKLGLLIMDDQDNIAKNNCANNRLNDELKKLIQSHPPPQALQRIVQILNRLPGTNNQNPRQLQKVIDELCAYSLNLANKTDKIEDLKKQQQIELVFKNFVSFQHHKQITIHPNQQQVINKYRSIISMYFHYFIHRTTLKNMTKLFCIFYKLLSLQMLQIKIVNLFFLSLILSHENLSPTIDIKFIKICLRSMYRKKIIYVGSSLNQLPALKKGQNVLPINFHLYKDFSLTSLSFLLIPYIVFFGNIQKNVKNNEQTRLQDTKMIQQIISNPVQITAMILGFRNQFPKSQVYQCLRDIQSLSNCIIDSYFLKSVLAIYLDYKLQPVYKQHAFTIVQNLVKFNLSQNTVKSMIKKLEITDYDNLQEQWKNVFQLLKTTLPINTKIVAQQRLSQQYNYKIQEDSPKKQQDQQQSTYEIQKQKVSDSKIIQQKNIMKFNHNSYLKFTMQHEFNGFFLAFKSYRILNQYILLKLKNQQQHLQICVSVRHLQDSKFMISLIKFLKNQIVQMEKEYIEWKPFQKHFLECELQNDSILFKFGTQQKSDNQDRKRQDYFVENKVIKTVKMMNIRPKYIVLGSKQKDMPIYPCQISSFDIKYCQGKITYNFIFHNKNKINQFSNNVNMLSTMTLPNILKILGQLDLFVLITSHLIRKVQNQQSLKNMLGQVINFLQCLVVFKGVSGIKLNQNQRQNRFYNVRSLVWLASRYKRDPGVILETLKILCIRGIKKPLQHLQILSNIGLWKQISSKKHHKVIQKIKQNCHQVPIEKHYQLMQLMKKIILDFIIFYKDTLLVCQTLQQDYLQKRSQIMKLVYDVLTGLKNIQIIEYVLFLLKILHLILDKTKNNDYIDTTIGFELTTLAYRLLYYARQEQFRQISKQKNTKFSKKISKQARNTNFHGPKSLNISLKFMNTDRDQQSLILKIQQNLAWIHEIIYFLKKQVLVKQQKIKYYDWEWDFRPKINKSTVFIASNRNLHNLHHQKLKSISQAMILTFCQHIQVGLMSFNKQIFNHLVLQELSQSQWQIYWKMNLFDEKICPQRFVQTLKIGYYNNINWDDQKIETFLVHSFDLYDNDKPIKVPSKILEGLKIKDINNIHNILLGVYLQKLQQNDQKKTQSCAENIMFILAMLNDSLYSNTQLLRQQISKQKRNSQTVYFIQKHLIVKQLSRQGFKLMSQLKSNQLRQLSSTIIAFEGLNLQKNQNIQALTDSKISQSSQHQTLQVQSKTSSKGKQNNQQLNVFCNIDVQYQQSFFQGIENAKQTDNISTQKIKQSLQHFKLLANQSQMQSFYKISTSGPNKKEAQQKIQGLIMNFNLSIDCIIKILQQSCSLPQKINQLQNYIFFIEKHICAFSKMIISQFLFEEIKLKNEPIKQKRKKSYKQVGFKFKQQSQSLFEEFLKDRRKGVYKMQNIWNSIQKHNKDFWDVFFKSEKKNQSVDQTCNSMKLKGLIKIDHQKRQIQLPKNLTTISNKFSISGDSDKDIISDSFAQNPHFGDIAIYQQQQSFEKQQTVKTGMLHGKDINNLLYHKKAKSQFLILYVTTTKIYQGLLICGANNIKFVQDKIPDEGFYDIVCANEHERRDVNQIQKKRQQFQIFLDQKSTIIPKRYLYYDSAVEIYSENLSYFFVFRKNAKRQQFLSMFESLKGTILNEQKLIEVANKQMQRWINGDISNYTYLMYLNDLSGRSFNDMSQYYIFPWILTNYKSQKFNKKFLNNEKNYRDLSKPVGALNKKRLDQLLSRYKQSLKYDQTQSYLYGSYCSNPAIVCNYLVRLEPFSMFHYLLQSKQFDLADRIFYSISNQFNCSYSNMGDYKELIPQFFSCPEFLRNRNKYKFGQKQNKQIVNNVELPEWAYYQFNSTRKTKTLEKTQSFQAQQQFVFRMRKCLQSAYVTANLNFWIDLMFGPYIQKEKAIERHNLYISIIYKNELSKNKNNKNKQTCLMFFKQFGQMPRDLFDRDHKPYKNSKSYYKIGDSLSYGMGELSSQQSKPRNYYSNDQYFVYWDNENINMVDLKSKPSDICSTVVPINYEIKDIKLLYIQHQLQDKKSQVKMDLMLYLKQGRLALRQLGFSTFRKKLQVKQQKESPILIQTKFQILQVYQQQKQIILVEQSNYRIYSYQIFSNNLDKSADMSNMLGIRNSVNNEQDQTIIIPINKKIQIRFTLKYYFTHHKSRIQQLGICRNYGLLVSIDSNRKVCILKLKPKQRQIMQYFRLKKFTNCQTITQLAIHEMGYIILMTSLNNIHMYNFMGDHIAIFSGNTIRQINKKMQKKQQEKIEYKQNIQPNGGKPQARQRKKSGNDIQVLQNLKSMEMIEQQEVQGYGTINQQEQVQRKQSASSMNTNSNISDTLNKNGTLETGMQQQCEIISSFQIWNHQSGQLIVGTQSGNLYRFDLFMIDDCEKINFQLQPTKDKNKKQKNKKKKNIERLDSSINIDKIQYINVFRIGRHWQCWICSTQNLYKIQSEDYRSAYKRNEQYRKKYVFT